MRINKARQHHSRKFRILLDSAFAKSSSFPKLKSKANLAHTVHDLGLSPQTEDEFIYQKATENDRFVLTINFKDFKRLVKKDKPGIIGIESQLTNVEIDEIVTKFISKKNPDDYYGKAVMVRGDYI